MEIVGKISSPSKWNVLCGDYRLGNSDGHHENPLLIHDGEQMVERLYPRLLLHRLRSPSVVQRQHLSLLATKAAQLFAKMCIDKTKKNRSRCSSHDGAKIIDLWCNVHHHQKVTYGNVRRCPDFCSCALPPRKGRSTFAISV